MSEVYGLTRYEGTIAEQSSSALKLRVNNDATRQEASNWLVKIRKTRKEVEEAGKGPIQRMKTELKNLTTFIDRIVSPLKQSELYLNQQIGAFVQSEREAAQKLQQEALAEAAKVNTAKMQAYAEEVTQLAKDGHSPTEMPAMPEMTMPEVVTAAPKSVQAESGESVGVRLLPTYDVGTTIIDGKPMEGANLTPSNPDFAGLPMYLFDINLSRLRAFMKSGQIADTKIRTYKKATTAVRG